MLETDALKEQLRVAKEKLTLHRRPRPTPVDVYSPDIRVWEMKLRLALEQNLELEQRLAWEIKQRSVAEKFIQHQIRHLQDMLEAVIETSPKTSPRRHAKAAASFEDRSVPPHQNLSPLLTEVMQVQLKFAETMQQLDHSVHAREKLLQPPTTRRLHDSFASYSSESDHTTPRMETYTRMLDRETPSPHHAQPVTMTSSGTSPMRPERPSSPQTFQPTTSTATVHLVQSRIDEEDLTTPKIDRSIRFHDCDDDDDETPVHRRVEFVARPPSPSSSFLSASMISSSEPSTSLYSMCPSSDLERSSFVADFAQFRQSLKQSARSSTLRAASAPSSPIAWKVDPAASRSELEQMKQQLTLDMQSLSTELTLLSLDPSHAAKTDLQHLQASVDECRSRMVAIDRRMRCVVSSP
ncbi:hypothetical protein SPRG_19882 [Saprolegnia parasitica CBS 223.65]|uniref:Uncharacterized protein n=1 Tax=Saprolegnia parasitica (strain CBS 223.65) TaxID=695850 RepID=A0A067CER1_SAPPC|nr:hypothetical protein SPRG_19882 [Saprolegnia parasitica CBS 223.65]KDO29209.1 hypothetical protein SPRG_19882 [Saprolegnia parasitica CBS 223.65]|eukprot:XP_012200109.1 hypothetical protein SPRG_19882 [Saprolegnia parasitica CBS 223.65]